MFVGIKTAQAGLAMLVDKVLGGARVILTRRGKPVVEMVPYRGEGSEEGPKRGAAMVRPDSTCGQEDL